MYLCVQLYVFITEWRRCICNYAYKPTQAIINSHISQWINTHFPLHIEPTRVLGCSWKDVLHVVNSPLMDASILLISTVGRKKET